MRTPDGALRSKSHAEWKRDKDAAEAAAAKAKQQPTHQPDAWETLCGQLRNHGSTHSQRAAFNETYERGVSAGLSWQEIYRNLAALRKQYETTTVPMSPSVKSRGF